MIRYITILLFCFLASVSSFAQVAEDVQLLPVKQNGKWGFINLQGQVVVMPQYEAVKEFDANGFANVYKNNRIGIINSGGEEILAPVHSAVHIYSRAKAFIVKGNHYSLYSFNGTPLTSGHYSKLKYLHGPNQFIFTEGNESGIIDTSGAVIYKEELINLAYYSGGYVIYTKSNKSGFITTEGETVLAPTFDEIETSSHGSWHFIYAKENGKWGVWDMEGNNIVPPKYDKIKCLGREMYVVHNNGKFLLLLPENKLVDITGFSLKEQMGNYYYVSKGDNVGILNREGEIVIPPEYDQIWLRTLFYVRKNGLIGLANKDGKILVEPQFETFSPFEANVALIGLSDKWGLINSSGEVVAPVKYSSIQVFEGVAKLYNGNNLTLLKLNSAGRIVSRESYNNVGVITVAGRSGGPRGRSLFTSDDYERRDERIGWFYHQIDRLYGYRDSSGNQIFPPVYKNYRHINNTAVTIVARTVPGPAYGNTSLAYGIVNDTLLKQVVPNNFRKILERDFTKSGGKYGRGIDRSGRFELLVPNMPYRRKGYTYIGNFENGLAPVNIGGELKATVGEDDEILMSFNDFWRTYDGDWLKKDADYLRLKTKLQVNVVCRGGQWGYIDTLGNLVYKPQFDMARDFVKNRAVVKLNDEWRIIDSSGEVLPITAHEIKPVVAGNSLCFTLHQKANKHGFIDTAGKLVIPPVFDAAEELSEGLVAVKKNGYWGYMDSEGKIVVDFEYYSASEFKNGTAHVKKNEFKGFINVHGERLFESGKTRYGEFSNHLAFSTKNGKYGYLNKAGETVIPYKFSHATDFKQNRAWVKAKNKKFGLINTKGEWIIRPKYHSVRSFNEYGYSIVKKKRKSGVVDTLGNQVLPCKFSSIYSNFNGKSSVVNVRKQLYGIVDSTGKVKRLARYQRVSGFSEGLAAVEKDRLWGYINHKGEEVIEAKWKQAGPFSEGYAWVSDGKNYYCMYKGGAVVFTLDERYVPVTPFSEGKAIIRIMNRNQYAYIDAWGSILYDKWFEEATPFKHGLARVKDKGWTVINDKGQALFTSKYMAIDKFYGNLAKITTSELAGLCNDKGEIILEKEYDMIKPVAFGVMRVEQGTLIGYLNEQGNWIWPLQE